MIDKVKLYTKAFEVKTGSNLLVKQGNFNLTSGEVEGESVLFYLDGEPIKGTKAFLNSVELPYNLDIDNRGLFLSFNPSLVINGVHNLNLVSATDLEVVMALIEEDLRDKGIWVNIDTMSISRLDLCKNVNVELPVSAYGKVFDWLKGKRMAKVSYIDTYTFRNQSREIVFYDKLSEVKKVYGVSREDLGIPSGVNIMRGELRLRNRKVVKRDTGLIEAKEVYNREVFEYLKERYKNILEEIVFNPQKGEQVPDFDLQGEVEVLRYYRENYKRNAFERYLSSLGIKELFEKVESLETLRKLLIQAGFSRRYSYKVVEKVKRDIEITRQVRSKKSKYKSLYSELYHKFCEVA